MASDPPSHLRLLWVPIIMALIAAGIVTLRGCHPDSGQSTESRPEASARESNRH